MPSQGSEIRAAFFDLDGTLIDSEVIYVEAVRQALLDRDTVLSEAECLALVYGRGWRDIYTEVAERFPRAYESMDEMEGLVRSIFEAIRQEQDIRIPGSVELLKRLSDDLPLAVVSGSPREDVRRGVEYAGVFLHLHFYLGAEDYFPGKPDPICYLTAAARMGVLPETCLVFEDSTAGVTAAKRAGMRCAGLQREGAPSQDLSLADAVYADLGSFTLEGFLSQVES